MLMLGGAVSCSRDDAAPPWAKWERMEEEEEGQLSIMPAERARAGSRQQLQGGLGGLVWMRQKQSEQLEEVNI